MYAPELGFSWLDLAELDCIWHGNFGIGTMGLDATGTYFAVLRCVGNGGGGVCLCMFEWGLLFIFKQGRVWHNCGEFE